MITTIRLVNFHFLSYKKIELSILVGEMVVRKITPGLRGINDRNL